MRTNRILCIGLSCLMLLSACGKINSHKDEDDKPKVEAKIENCQLEQYIDNFDNLVIKIQEEFNSTDLIITDSQDTTAYYNEQASSTLKHFGNGTWYLDVDGIIVKVDCADKLAKRFKYHDGRMNHTVYIVDPQQESGIVYSPEDGQFVVKGFSNHTDETTLDKIMYAISDDTLIYIEESLDSQVIDTLENGETVKMLVSNDKFGKIRKENGLIGYVPLEMLSETDPTEIPVTNDVTSENTTVGVTFETTTEETTEVTTTVHETVYHIKQVEIVDEVLPDGEYMINVIQPDEDYKGAIFKVCGLWKMSDNEYNFLEVGDTVFLGDEAYIYKQQGILSREVEWGESLIAIESGYMMDGYEPWVFMTYLISDNHHMSLDVNCTIQGDGVDYPSLADLWKDTIDNYTFCKRKGYEVSENIHSCKALAIIRNNQVCSILVNPEEHELWMSPELYDQKYGILKNREGSILSYSSDKEVPDYEIKMLSDEGLRYAINEIWARHGYIFRNQEILEYYRQFEWYVESVPADEWDKNGQNYYFNSIEQTNIEKLVKERDRRS